MTEHYEHANKKTGEPFIPVEPVEELPVIDLGNIPCPEGYPVEEWESMTGANQELYLFIIKQSKEIEARNDR